MKLFKPEVIGDPACPLLHRWTFLGERLTRNWPVKIMLHHFLPASLDRHAHDHPRPFVTFVLKGSYCDIVQDAGSNQRFFEQLVAPTVRYRSANYIHRTLASSDGAWTLVIMGPKMRNWGFWVQGKFVSFAEYRKTHKNGMRCE